jgi:DNA-binding NtrC family response regulator
MNKSASNATTEPSSLATDWGSALMHAATEGNIGQLNILLSDDAAAANNEALKESLLCAVREWGEELQGDQPLSAMFPAEKAEIEMPPAAAAAAPAKKRKRPVSSASAQKMIRVARNEWCE